MPATSTTAPLTRPSSLAARAGILAYGIASYALGMFGLFWFIAMYLDLAPFGSAPFTLAPGWAVAYNLALIAGFGVQHTIMARPAFKERWTKIIPPAMERSTFVLVTGVLVVIAMMTWQQMPELVWSVDAGPLAYGLRALGALGFGYLVLASFAIDHFELFGLKQVWRNATGNQPPKLPLVSRLMYRFDRHPLMTGILFGMWCTPSMRMDQLVMAAGFTVYIVIGVGIEERSLVARFGEGYRAYRRKVGALVPVPGRRA